MASGGVEKKGRYGEAVFDGLKNDEHQRLVRITISGLARTKVLADQLHDAEATWQTGRSGGLDMTFIRHGDSIGLNIFGNSNVIGLKVVPEREKIAEERTRLLARDAELAFMVRRQHAMVQLMTPEDLYDWWQFYDQIEGQGIYDQIGVRATEFSGLERASQERLRETRLVLDKLLSENNEYLAANGVAKVKEAGSLDLAFLAADGGLREVPLAWLKEFGLLGQVVRETIVDQAKVTGVMLPKEGESKREFETRVKALETAYEQHYGTPVRVARGTPGQISLWRKLGFGNPRPSSYQDASVTPGHLWRHLYFGKSNLEPGPLARIARLSLPGLGEEYSFPGIDLVFLRRTMKGGYEYAPLDGLAALDPHALRRNKFGVVPMDQVCGIKIFPDSWDWDTIKGDGEARRRVADAIYNMGVPGGHILYLNEQLLQYWLEKGTPFTDKSNAAFAGDLQRALSYGRGIGSGKEKTPIYKQFRLRPEVGGDKKALSIVSPDTGDTVDVIMDLGLSFEAMPEGFNGLGKQAGTADGLMRLLRYGILPMVPAWYAKEYLLQTVANQDRRGRTNAFWALTKAEAVEKDPVAQYLVQELFARCDPEELMAKLPKDVAESILKLGPTYVKIWRNGAQHEVAAMVPTHAHADHDALYPYATEAARVVAGAELLAFWKAKTMKAASWRSKLTYVTKLSEPKHGNSYQIQPREMYPYYVSGKPVRITDGVTLFPYVVDHSLVSRMQVFELAFGGNKSVLYNSGDWRFGTDEKNGDGKTSRALEGAAKHKPDIIVMETTNMGGNESIKPGLGLTEDDVRDTVMDLVKEAGSEAVVVVAPTNNLQRLHGLLQVAEGTGRKLAISPAHAEIERQLMAAKELAPIGADGFDWVLPYDIGTEDLTVWSKPMMAPRRHHEDMLQIAAAGPLGILDAQRLNSEGEKWIVVVSPFDIMPDQFDRIYFPHGIRMLYSAPFVYNWQARTLLGANLGSNGDWIKSVGAKVFMDIKVDGQGAGRVTSQRFDPKRILHVSGHPTPRQVVEALEVLIGKDRMKGVEIIDQMDRYNPADPLHSGYSLPISGGDGVRIILNHGEKPEEVAKFLRKNLGKVRK